MSKNVKSTIATIISISGIFTISNASLTQIRTGIIKTANHTNDFFDHSEYLHMARSLDGIIELTNLLDKYGCWCYFSGEMRGKGRGSPVDNIDQICKVLADGYACAKIDSERENCVPWEVDYVEGYNSKHPEVKNG